MHVVTHLYTLSLFFISHITGVFCIYYRKLRKDVPLNYRVINIINTVLNVINTYCRKLNHTPENLIYNYINLTYHLTAL